MDIKLSNVKELCQEELNIIEGGSFGFDVGWGLLSVWRVTLEGPAGYAASAAQYAGYYATH